MYNLYAQATLPSLFSALHLENTELWLKSSTTIPSTISQVLTPFQQILIVQALYPERTITHLNAFLSKALGWFLRLVVTDMLIKFLTFGFVLLELSELFPASPNLPTIMNETSWAEPILVLYVITSCSIILLVS